MYVNRAEWADVVAVPARAIVVAADDLLVATDLRLRSLQPDLGRAGLAACPRRGA